MYTSLKTLAGLFSVAAVCAALPTDEQPKRCGLTPTQGPTILVAVATPPQGAGSAELQGWAYGNNYCTRSQLVSKGKNLCTGRQIEFLQAPLTDKHGTANAEDCYANVKAEFINCGENNAGVQVKVQTDLGDHVIYNCTGDREAHGCIYNGQVSPYTEVSYQAFLSCGIQADP